MTSYCSARVERGCEDRRRAAAIRVGSGGGLTMCTTCGCGDPTGVRMYRLEGSEQSPHQHPHGPGHSHEHDPEHSHGPDHSHGPGHSREQTRLIAIEEDILAKNTYLAERNRSWLGERRIVSVNLMSSPGSGKTTLARTHDRRNGTSARQDTRSSREIRRPPSTPNEFGPPGYPGWYRSIPAPVAISTPICWPVA